MNQKDIFVESEGDRYYARNRERLRPSDETAASDEILLSIKALAIKPRTVLEIGCGNGWRLKMIQAAYGARCFGIEPSAAAVTAGSTEFPEVMLQRGTADNLPFDNAVFDLVIFGFCLYLCDRSDLFRIACEADRVLHEQGYLAILDFSPPFPYRNPYKHQAGVYAYKMFYADMFLWNPAYSLTSLSTFAHTGRTATTPKPDDRLSVAVLQKQTEGAYPDTPYPIVR